MRTQNFCVMCARKRNVNLRLKIARRLSYNPYQSCGFGVSVNELLGEISTILRTVSPANIGNYTYVEWVQWSTVLVGWSTSSTFFGVNTGHICLIDSGVLIRYQWRLRSRLWKRWVLVIKLVALISFLLFATSFFSFMECVHCSNVSCAESEDFAFS